MDYLDCSSFVVSQLFGGDNCAQMGGGAGQRKLMD